MPKVERTLKWMQSFSGTLIGESGPAVNLVSVNKQLRVIAKGTQDPIPKRASRTFHPATIMLAKGMILDCHPGTVIELYTAVVKIYKNEPSLMLWSCSIASPMKKDQMQLSTVDGYAERISTLEDGFIP
jgi:hypothetical protein